MKNKKLLDLIGDIDDQHIIEAEPLTKQTIKPKKRILLIAAVPIVAMVAIVFIVFMPLFNNDREFTLEQSHGITVKEINDPPNISTSADIEWLSEEELFSKNHHGFTMVAFEGTVDQIQNIVIDFGETKDYYAIASISVTDVLSGAIMEGELIDVLLPNPINTDVNVSETTYSSQIRVGQKGIFMPVEYNEHAIYEIGNRKLVLQELAPYGFMDGERWIVLQINDGLIYNKEAYPSLTPAQNLSQIKEIIKAKLN